jgi:hypothetical protein
MLDSRPAPLIAWTSVSFGSNHISARIIPLIRARTHRTTLPSHIEGSLKFVMSR